MNRRAIEQHPINGVKFVVFSPIDRAQLDSPAIYRGADSTTTESASVRKNAICIRVAYKLI
jgi:hypothetical protein